MPASSKSARRFGCSVDASGVTLLESIAMPLPTLKEVWLLDAGTGKAEIRIKARAASATGSLPPVAQTMRCLLDPIDPAILALCRYILRARLMITSEPIDHALHPAEGRVWLTVSWPGGQVRLLGDDEYGYAADANLPLLLFLVRMTMDDIAEEGSAAGWGRSLGLDVPEEMLEAWYQMSVDACDRIERAHGPIPGFISVFDWQLDAGSAQRLRRLPPALARPDLYPAASERWRHGAPTLPERAVSIFLDESASIDGAFSERTDYNLLASQLTEEGWQRSGERIVLDPWRPIPHGPENRPRRLR